MKVHQRRRLMALVVLAGALVVSAIAASSASAVLKRLPNGQMVSYQPLNDASSGITPFDTVFTNMDYNGGPVMPSNTDYMVLWSPDGLSAYPPEFVDGVSQFFRDLAHDSGGNQNVDSVGPQYNDLTGAVANYEVRFGGVLVDRHPYPASECPASSPVTNCLTDAQIQQELVNFVTARDLKTDLSHEYFLLTPPHVESCFSNNPVTNFDGCSAGEPKPFRAFCAYHQNTVLPTMLFYANDPYDADNSHCQDFNYPNGISDGEINGGLSHEHVESITDPIPNDAWTNGAAGPLQGSEVGDQCNRVRGNPLGLAPNGAKYNQVINGHFYWYQEEWSNLTHSCVQRLTLPATLPTARESVTAGSGTDMTFDASGSTAPGGVSEFSWQMNAVLNAPIVEQTTPTFTYTFPAAGAYSTGVTVFNPAGLSAGTGGIVTTGQNGFQPAFTVSQPSGQNNQGDDQTVKFSALTTVSGQPVINYLWEFGDGTTGSGATPTHTYQQQGTYTVTAVLFSGVGSAFPGAGAGPIYQQKIRVGGGQG